MNDLPIPNLLEPRHGARPKASKIYSITEFKVQRLREMDMENPMLDTPKRVAAVWWDLVPESPQFQEDKECMVVFMVNTRRRLLSFNFISTGTLDTLLCRAPEVFRPAIVASAAAIILTHNHPSGDPAPSEADIRVTRELRKCGELLKIELVDHIIIGSRLAKQSYCSLLGSGFFN